MNGHFLAYYSLSALCAAAVGCSSADHSLGSDKTTQSQGEGGESGEGGQSAGSAGAAGGSEPSTVDCSALADCSANPQCEVITASHYDVLGDCLSPPAPVGCHPAEEACDTSIVVGRSASGECRVFSSGCLAPGWTRVDSDPEVACGTAISSAAPICGYKNVSCEAACVVNRNMTLSGETVQTNAGLEIVSIGCTFGWFEDSSTPYDLNVRRIDGDARTVIGFVHDPSQCDIGSGGWYSVDSLEGGFEVVLCPSTCDALAVDTAVEIEEGCPTRRIDGQCLSDGP